MTEIQDIKKPIEFMDRATQFLMALLSLPGVKQTGFDLAKLEQWAKDNNEELDIE